MWLLIETFSNQMRPLALPISHTVVCVFFASGNKYASTYFKRQHQQIVNVSIPEVLWAWDTTIPFDYSFWLLHSTNNMIIDATKTRNINMPYRSRHKQSRNENTQIKVHRSKMVRVCCTLASFDLVPKTNAAFSKSELSNAHTTTLIRSRRRDEEKAHMHPKSMAAAKQIKI